MQRYRKNGFVLLIVLFLLQIISLIGLYSLYATQMNIKINRDRFYRLQNVYLAKNILHELNQNFAEADQSCRIEMISPIELVKKPQSWWKANGCLYEYADKIYFYVIESLGNDECSVINDNNSKKSSANYYRLTLQTKPKSHQFIYRLQTTITTRANQKPTCLHPRTVTLGEQMIRELNI